MQLAEEIKQRKHMVHVIMGDFNARLQYRTEEEQPNIGPFILGRGEEFALQTADNTQDNREFLSAAVREHDLFPMNTHFQQDNKHLVTYKEMATLKGEPWNATRYATLDYILTPGRWKNCITKAWSSPEIQTDSDHFILRATLRCKLAAKTKGTTKETFFYPGYETETKLQRNHKRNETTNCWPVH